MKVSVEGLAPNLKTKCIEAVEGIESVKCSYLANLSKMPIKTVFEVECDDADAAVALVKGQLRKVFGGGIVFRVVEYGTIYKPH